MVNTQKFKVQGSTLHVAHRRSQAGFTLVEILVAMTIFSVAVLGLAVGATTVMRANQTGLYSTIATNQAQDKLEELKGRPDSVSSCTTNCENPKPTYSGVAFTRTWTVTNNSPVEGVKRIDVTVTWTDYISHTLTVSSAVKD